ncbi:MAG: hypothetical protein GQ582_03580 [Methyloprofundus sp.]|nr:hypothetical protein [Methyloprofundus sp.]
MALTQTDVSQLFVTIFNRASEQGANQFWQGVVLPPELEGEQSLKAYTADEMLITPSAQAYFGNSLGDSHEQHQAFVEVIYLNTLNRTYAQDPGGVDFWTGVLDGGVSHGTLVDELIKAIEKEDADPVDAARFNNRVEVSNYAVLTITQFNEEVIEPLLTFYGQGKGDLIVTEQAYTVVDAKSDIDRIPFTYELTLADDNVTGRVGNDVVTATLLENSAESSLNPNDEFSSPGADTLVLTTDISSQSFLAKMDAIDVDAIELVSPAGAIWEGIVFDRDFSAVTLNMGQQEYNLRVGSLDAETAFAVTKLKSDGSAQQITFDTSDANVGHTTLVLEGDMNSEGVVTHGSDALQFDSFAAFSAASAIYNNLSLKNFSEIGNSHYSHTLFTPLGSPSGALAISNILTLDNVQTTRVPGVIDAVFDVALKIQHSAANMRTVVNMTDTDNVSASISNVTGSVSRNDDVLTLNAAGVQNTLRTSSFSAVDAEVSNINVVASEFNTDSVFNQVTLGLEGTADVTTTLNINVDDNASLTIENLSLRRTTGESDINMIGAGDVSISSLTTGAVAGDVRINAAMATGAIHLGFSATAKDDVASGVIADNVSSIMTGSGDDKIVFFAEGEGNGTQGTARIQGNGGGDTINVSTSQSTLVYMLETDSQVVFSDQQDETGANTIVMNGLDRIQSFVGDTLNERDELVPGDSIEFASTLYRYAGSDLATEAFTEINQKGQVLHSSGSEAADLQYFISRYSEGLFNDAGTNRAAAFADNGENGYLFIDVNSDGDFTETNDMVIQMVGVTEFLVDNIDFV